MLRTWIEDVIGRLKQLGTRADGLEEECHGSGRSCPPFTKPGEKTTTPSRFANGI
jgi:hypothetical protein